MIHEEAENTEKIRTTEFANILSDIDVKNVVIYVGDAVRWDSLCQEINQLGVTAKTVSASTHSPSSFASLLTGRYAPFHGVDNFYDQLDCGYDRLVDLSVETRFYNSIFRLNSHDDGSDDPIYSVLNLEHPTQQGINGLDEPFLLIERGPGGHAPYADYDLSAEEYFERAANDDVKQIQVDYEGRVKRDKEVFFETYESLEDRGLLEDTLVIYTSDHGELLGENGLVGHNAPMMPELVYVPSVFIHPDLPNMTVDGDIIHHVDLVATVLRALEKEGEMDRIDGTALQEGISEGPRPSWYIDHFGPDIKPLFPQTLSYGGYWDESGGWVLTKSSLPARLLVYIGSILRSAKRSYMLGNVAASLRAYLRGDSKYGSPNFSRKTAEEALPSRNQERNERVELSSDAKERLEDLGYR